MIVGAVLSAVLVLLAVVFPQYMRHVIAALICVWVASGLYVFIDTQRARDRLLRIEAVATWDESCPDPAAPLRVTFTNNNDRTLRRVVYTVEGFEPAFRSAVAYDGSQVSNRILAPGEAYSACRPFRLRSNERSDPATLDWVVTVNSAEFG